MCAQPPATRLTEIGLTELVLNSLPAIVAKTGVEALLIDTAHFYAELGAIELGIRLQERPSRNC